jgi:hypothetical protein
VRAARNRSSWSRARSSSPGVTKWVHPQAPDQKRDRVVLRLPVAAQARARDPAPTSRWPAHEVALVSCGEGANHRRRPLGRAMKNKIDVTAQRFEVVLRAEEFLREERVRAAVSMRGRGRWWPTGLLHGPRGQCRLRGSRRAPRLASPRQRCAGRPRRARSERRLGCRGPSLSVWTRLPRSDAPDGSGFPRLRGGRRVIRSCDERVLRRQHREPIARPNGC